MQDVRKLIPKILEFVPLIEIKRKIFYDEIPCDTSVSSNTVFNVTDVAKPRF
jgi:hypothetical protein